MQEYIKSRIDRLMDMGLRFDGMSFIYRDINFHYTDIVCMKDAEFEKAIEGAKRRKAVIDGGECVCGNPEMGFDCVCTWVCEHPGDNDYTCEYCGIYRAGAARCSSCVKS